MIDQLIISQTLMQGRKKKLESIESDLLSLETSLARFRSMVAGISNDDNANIFDALLKFKDEPRSIKLNAAKEVFLTDPLLKKYFEKFEGDLNSALRMAIADQRTLELYRKAAVDLRQRKTQLLSTFVLPLCIVSFTVIGGNWIASSVQGRAFRDNSEYQYKVETLKRAREDALRAYWSASQAKENIGYSEILGNALNWYTPIRSISDELDKIRVLGLGIVDSSELERLISDAKKQLDDYRRCLEAGRSNGVDICSKHFEETKIRDVSDQFSKWLLVLNKK